MHGRKIPAALLKLDITKAFDSVSWAFLLEILQHFGFGSRWRNLICNLLYTSTTRVLLNGQPGQSIQHRRGLRQGDPLSPMLFIIVMDVLTALITKAEQQGCLRSLTPRAMGHQLSIYADDVVTFTSPEQSQLNFIPTVLQKFGEASGLKANMAKSTLIPLRCTDQQFVSMRDCLPCELSSFPCRYLGLPLSIHKLTRADLQPIIDKMADRLPGWKAELMDKAGALFWSRPCLQPCRYIL